MRKVICGEVSRVREIGTWPRTPIARLESPKWRTPPTRGYFSKSNQQLANRGLGRDGELNMTMVDRAMGAVTGALLALVCSLAHAEPVNVDAVGVAAKGHDVVAMFEDAVVLGKKEFAATHDGANYRFSSKHNQSRFLAEPERYLPQYGGYCAYGVRMGQKLEIDPNSFVIREGKLYLLLNPATKRLFQQDIARNIKIANKLWPSISKEPAE